LIHYKNCKISKFTKLKERVDVVIAKDEDGANLQKVRMV